MKKPLSVKVNITIEKAAVSDAQEILALQKLAFTSVGEQYGDFTIPPLTQTLEEIRTQYQNNIFIKAVTNGLIVGSVRGYLENGTCYIGRLVVHPDFENKGLGSRLMQTIEAEFKQATRYELFTGHRSERNLYLYKKLGYKIFKNKYISDGLTEVFMEKVNHG